MTGILIAEDENRISSFIEKGLRAAGFQATVVRTGTDALDSALSGDFDLLVLDIGQLQGAQHEQEGVNTAKNQEGSQHLPEGLAGKPDLDSVQGRENSRERGNPALPPGRKKP